MKTAYQDLPIGIQNPEDELTPRQLFILRFIGDFIQRRGRPPEIREIGDVISVESPNGVMCHLNALAKKGYIRREEMTARGITLVGARLELAYDDSEDGRRLRLALTGVEGGSDE